jgi:HEAT repeat protein
LLVVPLVLFSLQVLIDSGAPTQRRAQVLANRLAQRQDWPEKLEACRDLPEVKALREAIQHDVSPALALLSNPRSQVQVAALAALEFRKNWPRGQAQMVLNLAQRATVPAVRAAAVTALGNVDDHVLIEGLAEFLRDPSREVRQAAGEALLWDTEHRWPMIRQAVCHSLADPVCEGDGPLHHEGQMFTAEAVTDLRAWTTQSGLLGQRAALTLAHHFARALNEFPSETLVQDLRQQLANSHTPPILRIELAGLLKNHRIGEDSLLQELLDPVNPASLRLLAAEALLVRQSHHTQAVDALHQLAKLPNRELALATAEVVQRCLGIDLGLALGETLPSIFSRQAAEVIRRLFAWSASAGEQREGHGVSEGGPLLSRPG